MWPGATSRAKEQSASSITWPHVCRITKCYAAASHEKELQQLEQQQKLAMERVAAARLAQLANEKRLLTQCESLDSQIQQAAMQANAAAVTRHGPRSGRVQR